MQTIINNTRTTASVKDFSDVMEAIGGELKLLRREIANAVGAVGDFVNIETWNNEFEFIAWERALLGDLQKMRGTVERHLCDVEDFAHVLWEIGTPSDPHA